MASITSKGGGGKKHLAADKQVRFSLTKDQKIYVEELVRLDNRIVVCREYITLWMEFFRFFAEDLAEKEISPAEEKAFFQVMTQLARKQFLFVELMADKFERGNDIINVLGMAVSIAHIQTMPENTRSKLELDWHSLFLDMNKTLGRLVRQLPGNMTLAQALDSLKDQQALGAQGEGAAPAMKGSNLKSKKGTLALALLFGFLGVHMFYLGRSQAGLVRLVTAGGLGLLWLFDLYTILTGKMVDGQGRQLI